MPSNRPATNAEEAINKRHNIYYDDEVGTLASAYYFRDLAEQGEGLKYVTLNGEPGVKDVTDELLSKL
jgi:adenylate kinase